MDIIKKISTSLFLVMSPLPIAQDLDEDLTLEKKPIIILPTEDANIPESIGNKITSILSQKATDLGRFEVIDRRLINSILEEQRLQNSGIFNEDQIVQIGELASAKEAFIVNIFEYAQKGVPKIKKKGGNDDDKEQTLSTWVVKTMVTATAKAIAEESNKREQELELENNINTILMVKFE